MSKNNNSDYLSPSFDGDADNDKQDLGGQEFSGAQEFNGGQDTQPTRNPQQAAHSYEYPRSPGNGNQARANNTEESKRSFGGFGRKNDPKDAIDIEEVAEKGSKKNDNESLMDKVKRIVSIVLTVVVLFLAIWGLVDLVDWVMDFNAKQDTPANAVRYMLELVEDDNYQAFAELLNTVEGAENAEALFDELQAAVTTADGQLLTDFVRIRLENGKEFLVSAYYDADTEQYELRSIVEISREYQEFFAR